LQYFLPEIAKFPGKFPGISIGVRAGGAGGAAAPPKQIAKWKSRANFQQKSGKKLENKK
jgi:hypothetical protein